MLPTSAGVLHFAPKKTGGLKATLFVLTNPLFYHAIPYPHLKDIRSPLAKPPMRYVTS